MKSQILSAHSQNFDKYMHVCNLNPRDIFITPEGSLPQLLTPRDSHCSDFFHHRLTLPALELYIIPIICAL